tara:strand:- start:5838 stop:6260 length:423 start_codon:yes stop_codon:yes gene_type:complete
MSYFDESKDSENISLEWLAMITGIITVIVTTYLIFGTDWNAYRSTNIVLGVAFLIFVTYAFTHSKKLKSYISLSKAKERALFAEIEKSNIKLAETELELREKEFTIDEMRNEASSMISTIDGLELKIEELEDKVKEALSN